MNPAEVAATGHGERVTAGAIVRTLRAAQSVTNWFPAVSETRCHATQSPQASMVEVLWAEVASGAATSIDGPPLARVLRRMEPSDFRTYRSSPKRSTSRSSPNTLVRSVIVWCVASARYQALSFSYTARMPDSRLGDPTF